MGLRSLARTGKLIRTMVQDSNTARIKACMVDCMFAKAVSMIGVLLIAAWTVRERTPS